MNNTWVAVTSMPSGMYVPRSVAMRSRTAVVTSMAFSPGFFDTAIVTAGAWATRASADPTAIPVPCQTRDSGVSGPRLTAATSCR